MIAFTNVNVIPMDNERVLRNQSVLIKGDRIMAIGAMDEVIPPDGAKVIEGNDAYLMPGLADMHMHIASIHHTFEGPDQMILFLAEGVTTVRNLSALPEHLVWGEAIVRGERIGPSMYNGRLVAGLPDSLRSLKLIFWAIVISSPVVVGLLIWSLLWVVLTLTGDQELFQQLQGFFLPSLGALLLVGCLVAWLRIIPLNTYTSRSYLFVTFAENAAEARRFTKAAKEIGYDFIKPYDYLREDAYLAALDTARQQNMYSVGHLLDELSKKLESIFTRGLREVAHVDEFMDAHIIGEASPANGFNEVSFNYETIPLTVAGVKENDLMVVSNLVADEVIYKMLEDPQGGLSQAEYAVVPIDVLDGWRTQGRFVNWLGQQAWRRDVQMPFLMTLTKALHDAGVPLLVGTDMTVEGIVPAHIHRDLELLVEAGLTPFEALEAGTRNAGVSVLRMGRDGNFGTIQEGQRADLILLHDNPLENVSHTRNRIGVMARGQWFPQAELDRRVSAYVATYR